MNHRPTAYEASQGPNDIGDLRSRGGKLRQRTAPSGIIDVTNGRNVDRRHQILGSPPRVQLSGQVGSLPCITERSTAVHTQQLSVPPHIQPNIGLSCFSVHNTDSCPASPTRRLNSLTAHKTVIIPTEARAVRGASSTAPPPASSSSSEIAQQLLSATIAHERETP